MSHSLNRRDFLRGSVTAGAVSALWAAAPFAWAAPKKKLYDISLAQWSLHKTFFGKKADPIDFPVIAKKQFGIGAVEYVNQFFMDKAKDSAYLSELKKRCDDNQVRSVLIMCDREGALGDPDAAKRSTAVENHYKWVEAAKFLGCHSIRVNAQSAGTYQDQLTLAADGLRKLTEFGAQHEISVIVENHGGLSSNGTWLASVIRHVDHARCGTLPDFGNFKIAKNIEYDRYKGVEELMPYAKGISAKSTRFGDDGQELDIDYRRMMAIVVAYGYDGYVDIEFEGAGDDAEAGGIIKTRDLLQKVHDELLA